MCFVIATKVLTGASTTGAVSATLGSSTTAATVSAGLVSAGADIIADELGGESQRAGYSFFAGLDAEQGVQSDDGL